MKSSFDKELYLAFVNLEFNFKLLVRQEETEEKFITVEQGLTHLLEEDTDEVSLHASDCFFFLLLGVINDDCIFDKRCKESYEPFVSELVHVIELDEIVGDEEELSGSLRHRLVELTGLHEELHRIVDLHQCLTCLLGDSSTFHQLVNQELTLDEKILRLVLL